MRMHVSRCGYVYMSAQDKKRKLSTWQLDFGSVVKTAFQVLETELRSTERIGNALNSRAISPALSIQSLKMMYLGWIREDTIHYTHTLTSYTHTHVKNLQKKTMMKWIKDKIVGLERWSSDEEHLSPLLSESLIWVPSTRMLAHNNYSFLEVWCLLLASEGTRHAHGTYGCIQVNIHRHKIKKNLKKMK